MDGDWEEQHAGYLLLHCLVTLSCSMDGDWEEQHAGYLLLHCRILQQLARHRSQMES